MAYRDFVLKRFSPQKRSASAHSAYLGRWTVSQGEAKRRFRHERVPNSQLGMWGFVGVCVSCITVCMCNISPLLPSSRRNISEWTDWNNASSPMSNEGSKSLSCWSHVTPKHSSPYYLVARYRGYREVGQASPTVTEVHNNNKHAKFNISKAIDDLLERS